MLWAQNFLKNPKVSKTHMSLLESSSFYLLEDFLFYFCFLHVSFQAFRFFMFGIRNSGIVRTVLVFEHWGRSFEKFGFYDLSKILKYYFVFRTVTWAASIHLQKKENTSILQAIGCPAHHSLLRSFSRRLLLLQRPSS